MIQTDFLRTLEVGMTSEKLIKSKERVQKHGEVFTPSWMVQKMLDTEGVKEACEHLTATFLEPAAGDGTHSTKVQYQEIFLFHELLALVIFHKSL